MKEYLAKSMDGMAKGLFASLLVGVMIEQFGSILNLEFLKHIGAVAKYLMGPCIGAGVAYSKDSRPLTVFSAAIAGAIGAGTVTFTQGVPAFAIGEPLGAFCAALIGSEIGKRIDGKTKFDILIVPGLIILAAGTFGYFVSPGISFLMRQLGVFVNGITEIAPVPMGILLGIVVGIVLTLPISSAALCVSISISGIAAGAALAGCCAQMVGFAVSSYRENKVSGLLSQGLGTSMLQMPNIIKKPIIWIPPTAAGAVAGFLSAVVFRLESDSVGAGMGTCGLVGPLRTYEVMGAESILPMLLCFIIIPAAVSLLISELMRRCNIIKHGDMLI